MTSPPLRRNRDFQLLWSGQALSALGSRVSAVAFPLLVLASTGSPAKVGVVLFAGTVPTLVLTLPAGVLVDRVDRKRAMIVCDAIRALALASIPAALAFDRLTFAHVVAVAAIEGAGWTVFEVAQRSALRHVVAHEQLPAAVARIQAREYAALLLGKPLGGLLFAVGRVVPFVFDALSYAASVVTLLAMRARFEEPRVTAKQHPLRELAEGIAWLARHRLLRKTSLLGAINDAVINSLFLVVIVASTRHGASAPEVGIALAFMGAGGLLGAVIATPLARRLSVRQVLVGSLATVTALLPLVALLDQPVLIGAAYGAMFLPFPAWNAVLGAYQLAVVPDRLQARVHSVTTLMHLGSVPFAALVVGFALDRTSVTVVVAALTGLMAIAVVVAASSRAVRSARGFHALGPQEPNGDDAILARA